MKLRFAQSLLEQNDSLGRSRSQESCQRTSSGAKDWTGFYSSGIHKSYLNALIREGKKRRSKSGDFHRVKHRETGIFTDYSLGPKGKWLILLRVESGMDLAIYISKEKRKEVDGDGIMAKEDSLGIRKNRVD